MVDNEQLKDVIGRIKYERKLSQEREYLDYLEGLLKERLRSFSVRIKKNMYRFGTY